MTLGNTPGQVGQSKYQRGRESVGRQPQMPGPDQPALASVAKSKPAYSLDSMLRLIRNAASLVEFEETNTYWRFKVPKP